MVWYLPPPFVICCAPEMPLAGSRWLQHRETSAACIWNLPVLTPGDPCALLHVQEPEVWQLLERLNVIAKQHGTR